MEFKNKKNRSALIFKWLCLSLVTLLLIPQNLIATEHIVFKGNTVQNCLSPFSLFKTEPKNLSENGLTEKLKKIIAGEGIKKQIGELILKIIEKRKFLDQLSDNQAKIEAQKKKPFSVRNLTSSLMKIIFISAATFFLVETGVISQIGQWYIDLRHSYLLPGFGTPIIDILTGGFVLGNIAN
ncbi:hypothetical protein ACFLQ1_00080 [Candidatus Auribacterota bacterium]